MAKGRSTGLIIALIAGALVIIGGLIAVIFGGAFAAYFLAREGESTSTYERDAISAMVALGDGHAIFAHGWGIGLPLRIRGVHADGDVLREEWTWSAPEGLGCDPLAWRRAGSIAAGELRPASGEPSGRELAVFDRDRGHVGRVEGIASGGFVLSEDGASLLVRHEDAIALYGTGEGLPRTWRAAAAPPGMVPRLGLTPTFAVVYDVAIRILRRGDGTVVREITDGREIAGIDHAREEMIWRRGGTLVVESLETGAERITIDFGTPVVDGMEEPSLLGSHGGRWVFIYSTELDASFQSPTGPGWIRHAPRTLAAVDPDTGAVVWRTPLGSWPRWTGFYNNVLYDATELPAHYLYYSDADVENGGSVNGHLAYISLADGAIRWQQDYPHATRGNALWMTIGDAAYLRVREEDEGSRSALARFENGRLTGAVYLASASGHPAPAMLLEDEAWIPVANAQWAYTGADLRPRARADNVVLPEATDWVRERLRLAR
jgi:hypothetical protein